MERLPEWERGTPAVLCVAGPHPIPITAYLRAEDDRVLLAVGRRRETLRRLREDPAVALLVMAAGLAFTAHGRARVIAEELEAADTVVAVELAVDRIQNHLADGRTEMLDGARWRWCAEEDGEAEDAILAELSRLRGSG
jgi:pyridoxamine 5'-phosphate oxidase-like protein